MSSTEIDSSLKAPPAKPVGRPRRERKAAPTKAAPTAPEAAKPVAPEAASLASKLVLGGLCLAAGVWAYGPTLLDLIHTWNTVPDYSHGFLVIPVALLFLWIRRGSFPGLAGSAPVLGITLLASSLALRLIGAKYFYTFLDGWSLVPWAAAVIAVMGGRALLWWCLPSIGFLIFMVPLPYRLEIGLSGPLQRIATKLSTTALVVLGQPAFAEGNVILLGEEKLEVAQACSGLRLFMSVLALTYAYVAIIQRPWWEKLMLAAASIPIAIISNAARIVATGLLYETTKSEWVRHFAHDSAGWGMILFAGLLFWLLLWYSRLLFVEEEEADMASVVRHAQI